MASRNPSPKQAAARIARQERITKEWELRRRGYSIRAIAAEVGLSVGAIHADLKEASARVQEKHDHSAREYRDLQLARLENMLAGVWEKAAAGNLAAVDRALAIIAAMNRILGLDSPGRVTIIEPVDIGQLADWQRGVLGIGAE